MANEGSKRGIWLLTLWLGRRAQLFKLLEYCYYAVLCLILCWISIPVNLSGSNATNNEFPSLSPVAVAMFCRY